MNPRQYTRETFNFDYLIIDKALSFVATQLLDIK